MISFTESDDIFAPVGMVLHLHEEPAIRGDAADGRQMVAGQRHVEDGRLPAWGISANGHWQQRKGRLINPDNRALLRFGLFLSAGQRSSHHALMAASLRWVAR